MAASVSQNLSVFYAPIWTDSFAGLVAALKNDGRFIPLPKDKVPQYLFPYATDIYKNDSLFFRFELKTEHLPSMCTYKEYLDLKGEVELAAVKISCFATGCAFVEFHVSHIGLSLEEIANFSFHFKRADKTDTHHGYSLTMSKVIAELFSAYPSIETFFTSSEIKRECRIFHQLFSELSHDGEETENQLRNLARGYHSGFMPPQNDSDYDMLYRPYAYDCWAGSQEGLVNLFAYSGNPSTDSFIDNYKREQLERNYSFMYLLLLNQRFSAIKLITRISMYDGYTRAERERLNKQIVQLKTAFAFNIISDDQFYQNVYRRMYSLLDIDRLLEDVRDNEQQVEIIQNHEAVETEKMTSRFLFALSVLSIFSVLIDASSYFDRIHFLQKISTVLSLVLTLLIIVSSVIWWFNHRRK